MYKTTIHDIDDLQKCSVQTWFDFEQDIDDRAIDHWHDHLRSCMHAGGGHFVFICLIFENIL